MIILFAAAVTEASNQISSVDYKWILTVLIIPILRIYVSRFLDKIGGHTPKDTSVLVCLFKERDNYTQKEWEYICEEVFSSFYKKDLNIDEINILLDCKYSSRAIYLYCKLKYFFSVTEDRNKLAYNKAGSFSLPGIKWTTHSKYLVLLKGVFKYFVLAFLGLLMIMIGVKLLLASITPTTFNYLIVSLTLIFLGGLLIGLSIKVLFLYSNFLNYKEEAEEYLDDSLVIIKSDKETGLNQKNGIIKKVKRFFLEN